MKYRALGIPVTILTLAATASVAATEYEVEQCSPSGTYHAVSLVDSDNDGSLEVLAGRWNPNLAELWDYDPTLGGLALIDSVPVPANIHDIDGADLDHDGDMDIVVGLRFRGVYALLNEGTSWTSVHVDGSYSWQTAIADFDGDGHPDIYSGTDWRYIKIFYGDGSGNFIQGPAPGPEHPGGFSNGMNVVDFNLDGRPDLLGVTGFYSIHANFVRAYPNLSTPGNPAWGASVGPVESYAPMYSRQPSVADFDENGYLDLVVSYDRAPNIFWGDGDGVSVWWNREPLVDYEYLNWNFFAGDTNQDGDQDIVAGEFEAYDGLRFHYGDGAGGFTYEEYPLDHGITYFNGLKLGDVSADGLTDIVAVRGVLGAGGFDVLFRVAACEPDPAGQGFWHRQCLGVPANDGGIDPGRHGTGPQEPTEPGFVEELMPCADARLEDLGLYGLTTCEGMDADPPSDPCERARKQATALVLNVCSERLQLDCEVDVTAEGCSSTNVGDLLEEVASLVFFGNCEVAAACGAAVNDGGGLVDQEGSRAGSLEKPTRGSSPDRRDRFSRRNRGDFR